MFNLVIFFSFFLIFLSEKWWTYFFVDGTQVKLSLCFASAVKYFFFFFLCIYLSVFSPPGVALSSWSCCCRSGTPALWRGEERVWNMLSYFCHYLVFMIFFFTQKHQNKFPHYKPESADTTAACKCLESAPRYFVRKCDTSEVRGGLSWSLSAPRSLIVFPPGCFLPPPGRNTSRLRRHLGALVFPSISPSLCETLNLNHTNTNQTWLDCKTADKERKSEAFWQRRNCWFLPTCILQLFIKCRKLLYQ